MKYPFSIWLISNSFRFGLLFLSALCAAMYLTDTLNNIDDKFAQQDLTLAAIDQRAGERVTETQQRFIQQQNHYADQQQKSVAVLEKQLEMLDEQITGEMANKNEVTGKFEGKRYKALQERRAQVQQEIEGMHHQQMQEKRRYLTGQDQRFADERQHIYDRAEAEKKQVRETFDVNDPRANDPMIVSFLLVLQEVSPWEVPTAGQFIFFLALALALLVEMGIVLAFENVVVVLGPMMGLLFSSGLEQSLLKTQLESEQGKEDIRHKDDLDAIRRKAEKTFEQTKTYVDGVTDKAA